MSQRISKSGKQRILYWAAQRGLAALEHGGEWRMTNKASLVSYMGACLLSFILILAFMPPVALASPPSLLDHFKEARILRHYIGLTVWLLLLLPPSKGY